MGINFEQFKAIVFKMYEEANVSQKALEVLEEDDFNRSLFDALNKTKQEDGSEEVLDDNEWAKAIEVIKEFIADALKTFGIEKVGDKSKKEIQENETVKKIEPLSTVGVRIVKNPDGTESKHYANGIVITYDENGKDINEISRINAVFNFVDKAPIYKEKDGQYNIRGVTQFDLGFATRTAKAQMMWLYDKKMIYIETCSKDSKTPSDEKFIEIYKSKLEQMEIEIDSNGQFKNKEGSKFIPKN